MFDPTKPIPGAPLDADLIRAQLNALNDAIAAIPEGPPGPEGPQGPPGDPGPPFASVQIGGVTTGDPGSGATASVAVFGGNVEISFTIPRGNDGSPGEVTNASLNSAIAGTALNPTSVNPLSLSISDPPTQSEVQALLDKLNELLTALKRT